MAKYKNISKSRIFIPNVGAVEPGEFLETDKKINSPFLELAKSKEIKPKERK